MVSAKAARAQLRQHALTFDGAEEAHPWGETVMKVRGKVFVFFGPDDDTSDGLMGVKLTRSLLYARSLPYVEPSGYGLGKSGWCNVMKPAKGAIDMKLMKDWLAESYDAVAPKRKARTKASRPHERGEVAAKRRR
jgi:predicted DNA-binding protein (MmcQ/YjbR family)